MASHKLSIKRIIHRMVRIYRMWRFVRLVEKRYDDSSFTSKNMSTAKLAADFYNYTPDQAVKALVMAEKFGYIVYVNQKTQMANREVAITGKGFKFASYTGLLEELSSSVKSFGSILAIIISILSLCVALYAANKIKT